MFYSTKRLLPHMFEHTFTWVTQLNSKAIKNWQTTKNIHSPNIVPCLLTEQGVAASTRWVWNPREHETKHYLLSKMARGPQGCLSGCELVLGDNSYTLQRSSGNWRISVHGCDTFIRGGAKENVDIHIRIWLLNHENVWLEVDSHSFFIFRGGMKLNRL